MTVNEFFKEPQEEVQEVFSKIKYFKKIDTLLGYKLIDLKKLPYIKVVNFIEQYTNGQIILSISELTGLDTKKILNSNHKNFLYFVSLCNSYLLEINELYKFLESIESENDNSTEDLKTVGIERLNVLGQMNVIDELANGDITKHETIENLPFERVFSKIVRDKLKNVIKLDYEALLRERSKR